MYSKILVALDHSPMRKQVFEAAVELAKTCNASLMLLHVLSPDEAEAPMMPVFSNFDFGAPVNYEIWDAYREQRFLFEKAQQTLLETWQQEATEAGVATEFSLNSGSPGRTICTLARSWGVDLIVLGRRGHSGLSELLMGSVSNYVLHHAHCSVLTIQGKVEMPPSPVTHPEMAAVGR
jgi:nucleotide-binding universal stress UspA family protein